jgi:hypothetical protein
MSKSDPVDAQESGYHAQMQQEVEVHSWLGCGQYEYQWVHVFTGHCFNLFV